MDVTTLAALASGGAACAADAGQASLRVRGRGIGKPSTASAFDDEPAGRHSSGDQATGLTVNRNAPAASS
ncbi:hypothetical protein ASE75_06870 [Sphingomonas sp. Leaf17]|nr:hypothetical protein ASE75_06870 [Sphingomonas sp. Leaf17]